jgi:hypothetical protein
VSVKTGKVKRKSPEDSITAKELYEKEVEGVKTKKAKKGKGKR